MIYLLSYGKCSVFQKFKVCQLKDLLKKKFDQRLWSTVTKRKSFYKSGKKTIELSPLIGNDMPTPKIKKSKLYTLGQSGK